LLDALVGAVRGEPINFSLVLGASAGLLLAVATHLGIAIGELRRREAQNRTLLERSRDAEATRDQLAATIELSREIVLVTDLDGTITHVNAAFATVTGYPPDLVLGRSIRDLPWALGDEPAIDATLASGESWSGPLFGRRADGHPLELDAAISPTRDPSGAITGSVRVARDVSPQRELEAQLRQAHKMETVGRLVGGIAHDFNNLLGAIRGYAELTHLAAHHGDEVHSFSAEVIKAADRAKVLTHGLLAFARQTPANPATVDLNEVVRDLAPMLRQIVDERTRLTTELSSESVFVQIDVALLEQAVLNLVINARDAIPGRGTINVATGSRTIGRAHEEAGSELPPGRYAVLAVTDTGEGISAEALSRLFEPFFTTKPAEKGTGLGLWTVHAVATGAGGTVTVDSRPGAGARFELLFPAVERVPDVPTAPSLADAAGLRGAESILLVEDEPSMCSLLSRILSDHGYGVVEATSAEEALRLVETGLSPALVVTDVRLPDRSGTDLADTLRAQFPGLGVVLISGYEAKRLEREAFAPRTVFLAKPFAAVEFLGAVRIVLDTPPPAAPAITERAPETSAH
jgi:PAS domain S-box-containing protein